MLRNLNQSSLGRRICGTPHVGVLAAAIPTGGDFPALGLNDIDAANDPAGCEYRVEILTWPEVGTLEVAEDTSFSYTPPSADFVGTVGGTHRVYKNGVPVYDDTYNFNYTASSTPVSADLVAGYSINTALASVSSDLAAAYGVKAYVSASLVAVYQVRQMVAAADLVATYLILSEVTMSFSRSLARTIEVLPTGASFAAPVAGFWNMADPKKPTGPKDPNSTIDIPFDWRKYLADITDTVVSHEIVLDAGLTDEGSQTIDGITTVFISGGTVPGKLPVTCRITTASTPARKEDRTIYLLIEER